MYGSFRRLELRLPVDHPVWNLPHGERSKIVREWLELGRRLTAIETSLACIETQLVDNAAVKIPGKEQPVRNPCEDDFKSTEQLQFDKDAFLKHFG